MRVKSAKDGDEFQSFNKNLLNHWCNPIQRKLLQLLRPIAKKHPQKIIDRSCNKYDC